MAEFELEGNSQDTINSFAILSLLGVALATACGSLLDRGQEACSRVHGAKGPPLAIVLLLAASYGLLVPGLTCVLFSFNIMLDFGIIKLGVDPGGGVDKVPAVTESMLGLIKMLRDTDCSVGAAAVVLYALVIPAVKLLLLLVGQFRDGHHALSAFCIRTVQSISKWACPDMFAYILIMYLVRGLNHPRMLRSEMQLDLGFTFFSLFCVGSTVASLGIHAKDAQSASTSFGLWKRLWGKLQKAHVLALVLVLAGGFAGCFWVGLVSPVMALRVSLDDLYQPKGPIPTSMLGIPLGPVIDELHIPEKANADVSLWSAMKSLHEWMNGGEVNSFIALVMLAVFVVALTVADMIVLLFTAACLCCQSGNALQSSSCFLGTLTTTSKVLRKLSMLDVLIMGILVVSLCMSMYQKAGIYVSTSHGLTALMCAELLHYITYYAVLGALEQYQQSDAYDDLGVSLAELPSEAGR